MSSRRRLISLYILVPRTEGTLGPEASQCFTHTSCTSALVLLARVPFICTCPFYACGKTSLYTVTSITTNTSSRHWLSPTRAFKESVLCSVTPIRAEAEMCTYPVLSRHEKERFLRTQFQNLTLSLLVAHPLKYLFTSCLL